MALEKRAHPDHPLQVIRGTANAGLTKMSAEFNTLYPLTGQGSSPLEQLLRALLL